MARKATMKASFRLRPLPMGLKFRVAFELRVVASSAPRSGFRSLSHD
jgi:hypothetical protein